MPGGAERWRWKAFQDRRPLYGLNRLAQRPDAPVVVVEGEKTADAAQEHFPEHVAITWPGGTNAVRKADWSILNGRQVVIWPDADEPGRKASRDVALMARAAGALDVAIVQIPETLPRGWDLPTRCRTGGPGCTPGGGRGGPGRGGLAVRLRADQPGPGLEQSRQEMTMNC
jgi:hypothetical protein